LPGTVKVFSEALGREVEVPEEPLRIVSLSPALTEILYRIGVWDKVVGVSVFCNKPPEARGKPRVGSYFKVNYKLLEKLEPDLVLTTTGAQRRVLEELVEKGFTVYPVPLPVSLYGVIDEVIVVGIVTGAIEAARRLAGDLSEMLPKLRGSLSGVKVYYEINLGGPVSAGGHSYIVDALNYLGARTPFDGYRQPWVINPDPRIVAEFDPDVVIYEFNPLEEPSVEKAAERLMERGLGSLRAVREGRILALPGDSLAHYGPSLVDVLEEIAEGVAGLKP
jgi:ABC-type Fe3+-hydroxamate transport system substrate-binding protein